MQGMSTNISREETDSRVSFLESVFDAAGMLWYRGVVPVGIQALALHFE